MSYYLLNELLHISYREQYILSHYVRKGELTDKMKSLFSSILELGNAFVRYHPMLAETSSEYVDFNAHEGLSLLSKVSFIQPLARYSSI